MKFKMPPPDVVLFDVKTGLLTDTGYDLFKALERVGFLDLADVATTAPTNNQVPIWNSTTGKLTFGAN